MRFERARIAAALLTTVAVSAVVLGLRSAGAIAPFEVFLYDFYVRRVAPEPTPSSDVFIVEITEKDIRALGHWPISDTRYTEMLRRLIDADPLVIGVDVYRDLPVPPGDYTQLEQILRDESRIVAVEKFGDDENAGVPPPPVLVGSDRVGFNDVVLDRDQSRVRRGLLYMDDGTGPVEPSFALVLALRALAHHGVFPQPDPAVPEWLKLGRHTLRPFASSDGGYVHAEEAGYQFLLLSSSFTDFPSISLMGLLDGELAPGALREKVAIVGSTAESHKDVHFVPFRLDNPTGSISGVELHAAIVQQLIDVGLGRVAPLRVLSDTSEALVVLLIGLLGSALGLGARGSATFGVSSQIIGVLAGAAALLAVGALCFRFGLWLPVVAPALSGVACMGVVTAWTSSRERSQRAMLMQIFSRNVSPYIAAHLWEHRDEFFTNEGRPRSRRMHASVVFTDMKGYTAHAEKMDPEQLMGWVNDFMGAMAHRVGEFGGFVDDYFGDGMKANFGVPFARTDPVDIARDAHNAVGCAFAMSEELSNLNTEYAQRGLPTVSMRIGVHSGPVVAGCLGSTEDRLKYTVVGDVVVTAQRLEATDQVAHDFDSSPCRILISDQTRELIGDDFVCEPLGLVSLKGKGETVAVHRVISAS